MSEMDDLRRDFEISRTACQMFERASYDWMARALKAESALVAQQDGAWQPIETAPKDGRTFYAIGLIADFEDSMHWALFWNGKAFECVSAGVEIDKATHWMIPDPPRDEQTVGRSE